MTIRRALRAASKAPKAFLGALWRQSDQNNVLGLASELAYSFLFALFPFLVFLIALAPFLPVQDAVERLLNEGKPFVPQPIFGLVAGNVRTLTTQPHGALLFFALLLSVWTASGATATLITGLNAVYRVEETRPIWKTRGLSMVITLCASVLLLLAVTVVVLGGDLGSWLSARLGHPDLYWHWLALVRWPTAAAVVSAVLLVTNLYCPNERFRLIDVAWGTLVGAICWVAITLAFTWYANHLANFNATYGSLGSVMMLLTWLYVNGLVLMLSGQINAVLRLQNGRAKRARPA